MKREHARRLRALIEQTASSMYGKKTEPIRQATELDTATRSINACRITQHSLHGLLRMLQACGQRCSFPIPKSFPNGNNPIQPIRT